MTTRSLLRLSLSLACAVLALSVTWLVLDRPAAQAQPLITPRTYPGAFPCNTTLQACLSGSGSGDVINIAANTYITNQLVITHALTLEGAGAAPGNTVLQALGAQRVISVGANIAAGVTISNLRVFGGSLPTGSGLGAGIFADFGTPLTLLNMEVFSNTNQVNSGGGIFAAGALTMTNVSVMGNSDAGGAGGGLRATGSVSINGGAFERNSSFNPGGGLRVSGPLSMTGVTVISNSVTAAAQDGGGIYASSGLFMLGGLVQNNVAPHQGGGIYATSAVISATRVISNAANDGGGMFVTGGLVITNSFFDKNVARAGNGGSIYEAGSATINLGGTSSVSGTSISNSSAFTHGGGIYTSGSIELDGAVALANNAAQNGEGGAIYTTDLFGGFCTCVGPVTFVGNTALGKGGALRALGDVRILHNPLFQNNSAGGGTTADGGAIYTDGDVSLTGGSSTGNSARNGGAVYAQGDIAFVAHAMGPNTAAENGGCGYGRQQLAYFGASATGCVAGQIGGAAYSPLTVTLTANSVFSLNRATAGGVAFANAIVVQDSTLISNSAAVGGALAVTQTLDIVNSTFSANHADTLGGAAHVSGTALVSNTLFTSNFVTATNGMGGALFARGGAFITNSTFISNASLTAGRGGGGAVAGLAISTRQTAFVGNRGTFGGAISATTALVARGVFTSNGNAFKGGGIFATNVNVLDSRFISNTTASCCAGSNGGGIYADGARIVNTYFEGNLAGDEGAAAYISKTAIISQSQFIRNTDTFQRSTAVFLFNALNIIGSPTSLVVDSLFDGNLADTSFEGGGAIQAARGTLTVSGSTFNNNTAQSGGAIFTRPFAVLNVYTSTFFNNIGLYGGGALKGSSVQIQNSTFISNYADRDGGGAVSGGIVSVQNSQFYSNSAESRMDGGAIHTQILLSVDGSTFEHNRILIDTSGNPLFNQGRGGALFVGGGNGANVTHSTFRRNRANDGGALACDAHCDVETSLFESNVADKPDNFTLTNIGTGGAIQTRSDLEVYRSRFLRNRAGVAGGAIYENRQVQQLVFDAFIQNSLFAENLASNSVLGSRGNAIAITGTVSNGKLFYNTVVSDSLTAGTAIVIMSGTVSVIDNIITNHAVGLEHDSGGTVFENFNLYFGNTANLSGTVTSGGTTFIGDPLFVSPATDDYHLNLGSPAINAGTDVLVNVDFDGDNRPIAAGFDIGFDEARVLRVWLPLVVR